MPAQLTSPISLPAAVAAATTAWPSASWLTSHLTKMPLISLGDLLPGLDLQVGDDDLGAVHGEHARRALAEARGAAGDDEDLACDVHVLLLVQASAAKARWVICSTVPLPSMRR